jgi:hypothetical protein
MAAITVTAAESGSTFPGVLLQVVVLTSVAASQSGAATAVQSSNAGAAHQANITTTVTGSQVYAASANVGSGTAYTANANSTLYTDQADGGNGLRTGTGRSTSATGTPGAITIGFTNPQGGGGVALLEILPNGTITEDGSAPAAVYASGAATVTTASFTPPGNSLLVAMVGADANTSTVVTVSDSSSLSWTQQVVAQTTGALYAAVWTAVVPAGGVSVSLPVATLALAAPVVAPQFAAAVSLPVATLALAAPVVTPAGSGAATISLPVAPLALAAPPVGASGAVISLLQSRHQVIISPYDDSAQQLGSEGMGNEF